MKILGYPGYKRWAEEVVIILGITLSKKRTAELRSQAQLCL
jgi:hypothetical protein